jgi:hypothetical protein
MKKKKVSDSERRCRLVPAPSEDMRKAMQVTVSVLKRNEKATREDGVQKTADHSRKVAGTHGS